MCFDERNLQQFIERAHKHNMTNGEYVFFYIQLFSSDLTRQPWRNHPNISEEEKLAYRAVKMVSKWKILNSK